MNDIKNQASIAGIKANYFATIVNLSYLLGLGFVFSIFTLILEKENEFVRSYAKQTLLISIITVISIVLNIIVFVGTVIYIILLIVLVIFQIIAIVYAILGKEFKIPYIEKLAQEFFVN